jgi:hypothetical protein
MKACFHCGNPLEDNARFCNVCGANQQAVPQQPVYTQPNPINQKPFKAPVWSIGLFVFLGTVLLYFISNIVSTIMLTLGMAVGAGLLNTIMRLFYHVLFVLFTFIGISIYNNNCRRMGYPKKKLSLLWAGIPLLFRLIFGFVSGVLFGVMIPMLVYEAGISAATLSIVTIAFNLVTMLISGLLNWLISCAILKAVVKNR